jgi:drug/metabolite transporter (DMT)-like permease
MCAVCLATAGVLTIVYAGSVPPTQSVTVTRDVIVAHSPAPFIGDLLTLVASVLYGLCQVLYKKFVALPSDPELAAESVHYSHIPESMEQADDEETLSSPLPISNEIAYSLPFGLHPNFVTTCMGACTLFVLWIPLPILHYYGIEEFALPSDIGTAISIAGICVTGAMFNASFMVSIVKSVPSLVFF